MKKNLQKLLMIFFAIFVIAICYKVPVEAADLGFQMTSDPTKVTDMITVEWNLPTVSEDRTIVSYSFSIEDTSTNKYVAEDVTDLSYSIKMGYGYKGYWKLKCRYQYEYKGHEYLGIVQDFTHVNTTPATIEKKNFNVTNIDAKNRADFEVIKPKNTSGVEWAVYYGSKCIAKKKSKTRYIFNIPISKNEIYKYRVRAYYTNPTNKKTYYGKWSSLGQFVNPDVSVKTKSSKAGVTVTIKKAKGVTKYKVYVSREPDDSFVLSKTIKVGSKNKFTVQITKYLEKRQRNYIKVVPEIKGYGSSDKYYIDYVYVYK